MQEIFRNNIVRDYVTVEFQETFSVLNQLQRRSKNSNIEYDNELNYLSKTQKQSALWKNSINNGSLFREILYPYHISQHWPFPESYFPQLWENFVFKTNKYTFNDMPDRVNGWEKLDISSETGSMLPNRDVRPRIRIQLIASTDILGKSLPDPKWNMPCEIYEIGTGLLKDKIIQLENELIQLRYLQKQKQKQNRKQKNQFKNFEFKNVMYLCYIYSSQTPNTIGKPFGLIYCEQSNANLMDSYANSSNNSNNNGNNGNKNDFDFSIASNDQRVLLKVWPYDFQWLFPKIKTLYQGCQEFEKSGEKHKSTGNNIIHSNEEIDYFISKVLKPFYGQIACYFQYLPRYYQEPFVRMLEHIKNSFYSCSLYWTSELNTIIQQNLVSVDENISMFVLNCRNVWQKHIENMSNMFQDTHAYNNRQGYVVDTRNSRNKVGTRPYSFEIYSANENKNNKKNMNSYNENENENNKNNIFGNENEKQLLSINGMLDAICCDSLCEYDANMQDRFENDDSDDECDKYDNCGNNVTIDSSESVEINNNNENSHQLSINHQQNIDNSFELAWSNQTIKFDLKNMKREYNIKSLSKLNKARNLILGMKNRNQGQRMKNEIENRMNENENDEDSDIDIEIDLMNKNEKNVGNENEFDEMCKMAFYTENKLRAFYGPDDIEDVLNMKKQQLRTDYENYKSKVDPLYRQHNTNNNENRFNSFFDYSHHALGKENERIMKMTAKEYNCAKYGMDNENRWKLSYNLIYDQSIEDETHFKPTNEMGNIQPWMHSQPARNTRNQVPRDPFAFEYNQYSLQLAFATLKDRVLSSSSNDNEKSENDSEKAKESSYLEYEYKMKNTKSSLTMKELMDCANKENSKKNEKTSIDKRQNNVSSVDWLSTKIDQELRPTTVATNPWQKPKKYSAFPMIGSMKKPYVSTMYIKSETERIERLLNEKEGKLPMLFLTDKNMKIPSLPQRVATNEPVPLKQQQTLGFATSNGNVNLTRNDNVNEAIMMIPSKIDGQVGKPMKPMKPMRPMRPIKAASAVKRNEGNLTNEKHENSKENMKNEENGRNVRNGRRSRSDFVDLTQLDMTQEIGPPPRKIPRTSNSNAGTVKNEMKLQLDTSQSLPNVPSVPNETSTVDNANLMIAKIENKVNMSENNNRNESGNDKMIEMINEKKENDIMITTSHLSEKENEGDSMDVDMTQATNYVNDEIGCMNQDMTCMITFFNQFRRKLQNCGPGISIDKSWIKTNLEKLKLMPVSRQQIDNLKLLLQQHARDHSFYDLAMYIESFK